MPPSGRRLPNWKPAAVAGALAALLCAVPLASHAGTLESRVMVLPSEGEAPGVLPGLADELTQALTRGARRNTTSVASAAASLDDTAVVVGCDPSGPACLDAVAAALNVDQLLLVRITPTGAGASIEVTAVTREAAPVTRVFAVTPATRKADLAAIETAVPEMLEAGEARPPDRPPGGDGIPPGGGPGTGPGVGPGSSPLLPGGDGPPPPAPSRTPLYVIGGGGALVVAGAVFWGLASAKQDDIDRAPTGTVDELERLASLEDRARTQATVGNALVIGGGVAMAGGAIWWLTTRRRADVVVAPAPAPGGATLMLEGRW